MVSDFIQYSFVDVDAMEMRTPNYTLWNNAQLHIVSNSWNNTYVSKTVPIDLHILSVICSMVIKLNISVNFIFEAIFNVMIKTKHFVCEQNPGIEEGFFSNIVCFLWMIKCPYLWQHDSEQQKHKFGLNAYEKG